MKFQFTELSEKDFSEITTSAKTGGILQAAKRIDGKENMQ
jgi:hypothetical protein